jgi:hypothetical protein
LIFGAKRPNYCTYSITVDGNIITNGNARSDTPAVNQLLGEVKGLANGQHTAMLTNTGNNATIDIDRVQLQSQIGTSGCVRLDWQYMEGLDTFFAVPA